VEGVFVDLHEVAVPGEEDGFAVDWWGSAIIRKDTCPGTGGVLLCGSESWAWIYPKSSYRVLCVETRSLEGFVARQRTASMYDFFSAEVALAQFLRTLGEVHVFFWRDVRLSEGRASAMLAKVTRWRNFMSAMGRVERVTWVTNWAEW
jgi:hypothetical protein